MLALEEYIDYGLSTSCSQRDTKTLVTLIQMGENSLDALFLILPQANLERWPNWTHDGRSRGIWTPQQSGRTQSPFLEAGEPSSGCWRHIGSAEYISASMIQKNVVHSELLALAAGRRGSLQEFLQETNSQNALAFTYFPQILDSLTKDLESYGILFALL